MTKQKSSKSTQKPQQRSEQNQRAIAHIQQEFYGGPIPPPAALEHYERISPGAAERLIRMAETEAAHRHQLENMTIKADITETRLGQIFAFLIGIFTIGCGAYAAIHGAQIAGSFIGTGGVIGLVAVFIYGRKRQSP